MKIKFVSKMKEDNKLNIVKNNNEVVVENVFTEPNKYIFPMHKVEENSNVSWIGYIKQTNILFIQYKIIRKSVDGYEIGVCDEPLGYFYHNVDEIIYNNLLNSPNKAKYINENIKKEYEYHKEPIMNII